MFDREKFLEYEAFFAEEHERSFELLPGRGRVMVSAPHSVEQTRSGAPKYAEPQTGSLARMLHDSLGCPVIYKTKNCGDDANFDPVSPYKDAVEDYVNRSGIAFLLDLHQMAPWREEQINLGTGEMRNISHPAFVDVARQAFDRRALGPVQLDQPFGATYPYTVSAYVAGKCGISCMQIEMNSKLVRPGGEKTAVEQVYEALKEIIQTVEKM